MSVMPVIIAGQLFISADQGKTISELTEKVETVTEEYSEMEDLKLELDKSLSTLTEEKAEQDKLVQEQKEAYEETAKQLEKQIEANNNLQEEIKGIKSEKQVYEEKAKVLETELKTKSESVSSNTKTESKPKPKAKTESSKEQSSATQTMVVTAYTAGYESTGKNPSDAGYGVTASGKTVSEGTTLACPPSMPFGTVVDIEGVGKRVCQDRGGDIKEGRLDVYIADLGKAQNFGRQTLTAHISK